MTVKDAFGTAASDSILIQIFPAGVMPPTAAIVPYLAGWNLVSGPLGTQLVGLQGPLYTYDPDAGTYHAAPVVPHVGLVGDYLEGDGGGYWAYFVGSVHYAGLAPEVLVRSGLPNYPTQYPVPAGRYALIGNPYRKTATVSGADAIYVYSPDQGYQLTTMLQPGQGAWAYSSAGATLLVSPADP
ncbi:MAG: hypothetical protein ACR2PL_15865 [Dehalococcoidia bacterium]